MPLAWRVEETEGAIGFEIQKAVLEAVAPWLPAAAEVRVRHDGAAGWVAVRYDKEGRVVEAGFNISPDARSLPLEDERWTLPPSTDAAKACDEIRLRPAQEGDQQEQQAAQRQDRAQLGELVQVAINLGPARIGTRPGGSQTCPNGERILGRWGKVVGTSIVRCTRMSRLEPLPTRIAHR